MGFIEKRAGGYRVRYRDPLGRQRSKTLPTKALARRFLTEMEADVARGNWIDPDGANQAVGHWAEEFLSLCRRLSPTSQETYRRDLERYVLPRFGSYRLGRIPAEDIENWLNDELADGLAPSTVHRHYRTLRRMLQVAVDKERLPANPCDRVEPPRVPKRDMMVLTWEQAVALAEAHTPRFRALIYVAVDTGMRWSELIGLRQARVDLRNHKIRVTEQLVQLRDGEWFRKEPKTPASIRSITLSPVTVGILAEHLDQFAAPGPDGLVFPNGAGNPISHSSFQTGHFKKAQDAVGLRCRFHDLRHTSVALASGA